MFRYVGRMSEEPSGVSDTIVRAESESEVKMAPGSQPGSNNEDKQSFNMFNTSDRLTSIQISA